MTIFTRCKATLNQATMLVPEKPKPLREMCLDGAKALGVEMTPEYIERMDYELGVIERKGYEDYFYIVADLMQWANSVMLTGPGRGSSAGSLVAYLLQITRVDPIKHDLLFFRFLQEERNDPVDIDSDFADRDGAITYLQEKYGENRVQKIGTIGTFQRKSIKKDVCAALDIPLAAVQPMIDEMPDYSANDPRKDMELVEALKTVRGQVLLQRYPEFGVVKRMGAHPSASGTHASGVAITERPLDQYAAIDHKKGHLMLDGPSSEALGILKLDILGTTVFTKLQLAMEMAGKHLDVLRNCTYDDPAVFDVLNQGKFTEVFQISGKAAAGYASKVQFDDLEDIAALLAIARPGPMDSGAADAWVRRKRGEEPITYAHPALEPFLKGSKGVMVYQEQIMQIANAIAGMPWPEVTSLRKAIGKSQGAEALLPYQTKFVGGCVRYGLGQDQSEKLWNEIVGFGKYGFSRNHAIPYAITAYWTCYLKAHHPLEFAAACLTMQKDKESQIKFLRELDKEGVKYKPVDVEKSTDKWRVVDGNLLGPLQMIKGVGPKVVQQILSCRARGEDLPDNIKKKLTSFETEIDSLFEIEDALKKAGFWDKGFSHGSMPISHWQPNGTWQDVKFAGRVVSIETLDENDEKRVAARIERGQIGVKTGPTKFLQIKVEDSTGEILIKINANEYESRAPRLTEALDVGSLVCVDGNIMPDFAYCLNNASKGHGIWRI